MRAPADTDVDTDADTDADADMDTDADSDDTAGPGVVLRTGPLLSLAPRAPSTARLELSTDLPTTATVTLDDGERRWSLSFDEATTTHVLPLVGARAERTVAVSVELTGGGGALAVDAGAYTTPPLPEPLAALDVVASAPARMEPGYTLLPVGRWLTLLDEEGEVVWYAEGAGAIHELLPTTNGTYRYLANRTSIRQVDPFGEVVGGWRSQQIEDPDLVELDLPAVHHDVQELPDGTLLTLSVERRFFEYPTSERRKRQPWAEAWVAGDVLVHFDAAGQILGQWPLLDLLEPTRIAYDGVVGSYWEDFPPWEGDDIKDWSHGNAVSYDPVHDRFLVGLRHQDAVVAIDRGSGTLAWILAPLANWPPTFADALLLPDPSNGLLPYHMHGAKFTAPDRVILFDNGNRRASAYQPVTPEEEVFSRVVEYEIDEVARRYRRLWSHGEEEGLFSGSLGDADVLPTTDNVLITWGNLRGEARGSARVQEVTRDHVTVFDVWVPSGTVFRSQRVPSLLP